MKIEGMKSQVGIFEISLQRNKAIAYADPYYEI